MAFNNEINVGGWYYRSYLFRVDFALIVYTSHYSILRIHILSISVITPPPALQSKAFALKPIA